MLALNPVNNILLEFLKLKNRKIIGTIAKTEALI